MRRIQSASPRQELREYVRAFGQRQLDGLDSELPQPVPASLEQIIEFEFYDPPIIHYRDGRIEPTFPVAVVGPHTFPVASIWLPGHIESFAIFFQPLALWQLFRIPPVELADTSYEGCHLLGNGIRELWHKLAEQASFAKRVQLAEDFLIQRAATASGRSTTMSAAFYLFQRRGSIRIGELASQASMGLRQFERRFSDEIGFPPKLFARITRFQMALDAKIKAPDRSWLYIAHEFGYHDQMHMVRDFHSLSGDSPSRMLMELGDTRPAALAAS